MKIKRFFSQDMRSAIRLVREELGADAVILSNDRVNGGVEIVAAVDYDEAILEPSAASTERHFSQAEPNSNSHSNKAVGAEQARRHDVKPGLTGWAQINGRNDTSWEKRLALDVWYVENQSLWLDLKIVALTFSKVIRKDGINPADRATMPEFLGTKKESL